MTITENQSTQSITQVFSDYIDGLWNINDLDSLIFIRRLYRVYLRLQMFVSNVI